MMNPYEVQDLVMSQIDWFYPLIRSWKVFSETLDVKVTFPHYAKSVMITLLAFDNLIQQQIYRDILTDGPNKEHSPVFF